MAIVTERDLRQTLTATVAKRSNVVQDLVYNSTPLTRILRDRGNIRVKRAGGPELRIPVQFDKLGAQWFTGYDKIEITPKELLNSAVFPWARVVSMFSLTGTELLYNSGEEAQIDLMEFYIDSAEKAAKEEFELSLVQDGTGAGGRQMIGMGGALPIVPNAGVYGGIDRAEVVQWRTSTFNATTDFPDIGNTWDSTTARPIIERISLNRSVNGSYADLLIADAASYEAISSSFVAHQRLASERSARLGYFGLTYATPAGPVEIVAAGGIGSVTPANTIFGIDTSALAIYEFPNQSFVPFHSGDGMKPINQDAIAQGIVWSGQMVLENPRTSWRLITA